MRVTGLFGLIAVAFLAVPALAEDKAKLDPAKLVGSWTYVSGEKDGKKSNLDDLKKQTVEVSKEAFTLTTADAKFVMKYKLDPSKSPCAISFEIAEGPFGQGAKAEGIIALDGDQLKLCYSPMGGAAPKEFVSKEGSGLHNFVLKRKK